MNNCQMCRDRLMGGCQYCQQGLQGQYQGGQQMWPITQLSIERHIELRNTLMRIEGQLALILSKLAKAEK